MRHFMLSTVAMISVLLPSGVFGQFAKDVPSTADYANLLKATKFVANYQESAAVSARVFAARGTGSDKDFAQAMAIVAKADLSDAQSCLVGVYRSQDLTKQDVEILVSFFDSPLGIKLVELGKQKMIADIERGAVQPFPAGAFTEEERRQIAALQQNVAYRKYSFMSANPAVAKQMVGCILESRNVKNAGLPLEKK